MEYDRQEFIRSNFSRPDFYSEQQTVRRSNLYDDVLTLFNDERLTTQWPIHVTFCNERAIDFGGVGRDMISGFWEEVYEKLFDGCQLLTPVCHAQSDTTILPLIGRIISYGYLCYGILPIRIAFPTLASILLGPNIVVPDEILVNTFSGYITSYESSVLNQAMHYSGTFSENFKMKLLNIFSRFGCRQLQENKIKELVVQAARFEFLTKPFAQISLMHSGISPLHTKFWNKFVLNCLHTLYISLVASTEKILQVLKCEPMNENENRVFGYLQQFIGDMKPDVLRKFLRYTTGSSVCVVKFITITFNSLTGIARRPISHTCDCMLELPSTYGTYLQFVTEFEGILAQPESEWVMDAV